MGWTPPGILRGAEAAFDVLGRLDDWHKGPKESAMDAMTVGIDLAKDVFELAIAGAHGQIRTRRRLSRRQFAAFVESLPAASVVVMEACGTPH